MPARASCLASRVLFAAALLVTLGAPASPAAAAAVRLDQPCYPQRSGVVAVHGTGFAPGAGYRVRVGATVVASGTVGAGGAVSAAGVRLPPATAGRTVAITVSDGSTSAAARARVVATTARLLGATGGRVRLAADGFGAHRQVFLHYVSPSGRPARTVRLGVAAGPCGRLLTGPRPLFPFAASPGSWTLQLDTRAAFSPRPFPPVARIVLPVVRLG